MGAGLASRCDPRNSTLLNLRFRAAMREHGGHCPKGNQLLEVALVPVVLNGHPGMGLLLHHLSGREVAGVG